jgi:hypothetical protein
MSDPGNVAKSIRDRLGADDRLGKALSDLLESPLLTGAVGAAFDARERASQAQEVALGALNIPSAADIERLTRRLRSVSHRLEAIEDGVDRLDRALTPSGVEARLSAIEGQLRTLTERIESAFLAPRASAPEAAARASHAPAKAAKPGPSEKPHAAKARATSKARATANARATAKARAAAKTHRPSGVAKAPSPATRAAPARKGPARAARPS